MTDRPMPFETESDVPSQSTSTEAEGSAALHEAKAEVMGLVHDVRAYVAAERALWTGRAAFTGKTLKQAAIIGAVLVGLVVGALNILALGGLLILSSVWGPIAATLVMTGGIVVIIAALAFWLMRIIKSLKFSDSK